jgi:hypothetical protein
MIAIAHQQRWLGKFLAESTRVTSATIIDQQRTAMIVITMKQLAGLKRRVRPRPWICLLR